MTTIRVIRRVWIALAFAHLGLLISAVFADKGMIIVQGLLGLVMAFTYYVDLVEHRWVALIPRYPPLTRTWWPWQIAATAAYGIWALIIAAEHAGTWVTLVTAVTFASFFAVVVWRLWRETRLR